MPYYNTPLAAENQDESQPLIQANFTQIDASFGVDHYPMSNTTVNNGYHKDVHIIERAGNPGVVATSNIVYGKSYTPDSTGAVADTQLFSITANGGVSQLTGKSEQTDGWAWSGGILYQWGSVTFGAATAHKVGTVTFKDRVVGAIPFPTACFQVYGTLNVASSTTTTASNTFAIRSFSNTQFIYVFNSSSSSGTTLFPSFNWFAVGY